jgi:hypothetical protein
MWRDIVVGVVCAQLSLTPAIGSGIGGRNEAAVHVAELGCAILERVELGDGRRLTFSWRNTCGFQIILSWRSRADDGASITGTVIVPPQESVAAECSMCAFPDWTESRQSPETSATRL